MNTKQKNLNSGKHLRLDQLYIEYRVKLSLIEVHMNKLMHVGDLRLREQIRLTVNQLSQALELYECAIYGFVTKQLMDKEIGPEDFESKLREVRLMVLAIKDQFAHKEEITNNKDS